MERITSPMKIKAKKTFSEDTMSTDDGQEGSTPHQFFFSFIDLLQYFKTEPIQIKKVNKVIKEMSKIKGIPNIKDLEAIENEKVSQSCAFYSII